MEQLDPNGGMRRQSTAPPMYPELSAELLQSIQHGRVGEFVARMEEIISRYPNRPALWAILARAHDAQHDVSTAARCWAQAIQVASPDYRYLNQIASDAREYAYRHGHHEIIDLLQRRFAVNRTESSSSRPPFTDRRTFSPAQHHLPNPPDLVHTARQPLTVNRTMGPKKRATSDELEPVLRTVEALYQQGDRSPATVLKYAQLLQRLGRGEESLGLLQEGLPSDVRRLSVAELALLNSRAQILSSLSRWDEAAEEYTKLARHEIRPAAKRFARIQLSIMYWKGNHPDDARRELQSLLKEDPQDLHAWGILRTLDRPAPMAINDFNDFSADADGDDLASLAFDTDWSVSRLLLRDVDKTDFRDWMILKKGGRPDPEDAARLMDTAMGSRMQRFPERYPLFLEAAKAYKELPPGSQDQRSLMLAVARYANLKAASLLSDMVRKLTAGDPTNPEDFTRLRDTISSYSLETVDLQLQLHARKRHETRANHFAFILQALSNHLRAQVLCVLLRRGQSLPPQLLTSTRFEVLFEYCTRDEELARLAFGSLVACGALSTKFANWIQRGGRGLIRDLRTTEALATLNQLGAQIPADKAHTTTVGEALRRVIEAWADKRRAVAEFLHKLECTAMEPSLFAELAETWSLLPRHHGPLLDTDIEVIDRIQELLTPLSAYNGRSPEERTKILSTALAKIDSLRRFIDQNPTYWGCARLEPLLDLWRRSLNRLYTQRMGAIEPSLTSWLEPPVFHEDRDSICGALTLKNSGTAAAEGAALHMALYGPDGASELWTSDTSLEDEISVGSSISVKIVIPRAPIQSIDQPLRLEVAITPHSSHGQIDAQTSNFQVEVSRGATFQSRDIPWQEAGTPIGQMFKGRDRDLDWLVRHLKSRERINTPLLFGLTRTGKSSLLDFLDVRLHLQLTEHGGEAKRFFVVRWHLGEAANHNDSASLWNYLLRATLLSRLRLDETEGRLTDSSFNSELLSLAKSQHQVNFNNWRATVTAMAQAGLYPVFLIDEFSYFRNLVDKRLTDAAFLSVVREMAIGGAASFVLAGTYDVRELVKDSRYGITAQFANVLERRISQIDTEPARALVNAMGTQLQFTSDAAEQILRLAFRIPYFIQLICRKCALYALNKGRSILGALDVETVASSLTEERSHGEGDLERLPPNKFQHNMHNPHDPPEHEALLTTICDLQRGQSEPRAVLYNAILERWRSSSVPEAELKLARAIRELKDRQVILERPDEGRAAYLISVDLFRRWWADERRYLDQDLDLLKRNECAV